MNTDLKDLCINYIKIFLKDKNGNLLSISSNVNNIFEKTIIVNTNEIYLKNVNYPQDVQLSFICSDGLYKSNAKLKNIKLHNNYVSLEIDKSDKIEYHQNREYFRVAIEKKVNLKFNNKIYSCTTNDLSANGVSLMYASTIDIPKNVNLELLFEDYTVCIYAEFIRINQKDNSIAFHFKNISNSDIDYISKICIKQQLEQKRRSYN